MSDYSSMQTRSNPRDGGHSTSRCDPRHRHLCTIRANKAAMGVAPKTRFAVIFLMMLALGLGPGLAAEDIPETPYDETEALPYESIPLFSIVLSPLSARSTQAPLSSVHLGLVATSPFIPAHVRATEANRAADLRIALALLCTLLC